MLAQRTPILLRESKYWRVAAIQALNSNTHLVHQWLGPHYMYNMIIRVGLKCSQDSPAFPSLVCKEASKYVTTEDFDGVSIFSGGFFKRYQSFGIVLPCCSFPATQDCPLTIYKSHFIITVSLSLSVFTDIFIVTFLLRGSYFSLDCPHFWSAHRWIIAIFQVFVQYKI